MSHCQDICIYTYKLTRGTIKSRHTGPLVFQYSPNLVPYRNLCPVPRLEILIVAHVTPFSDLQLRGAFRGFAIQVA